MFTAVVATGMMALAPPPCEPLTPEQIAHHLAVLKTPYDDEHRWPAAYTNSFRAIVPAGPGILPALTAAFAEPDRPGASRAILVRALRYHFRGTLRTPDPQAVAMLEAAFRDPAPIVRLAALDVVKAGSVALNTHPYMLNPCRLAYSLPVADAFLPRVVTAVGDPDPRVATLAARVLSEYKRPGLGVNELLAAAVRHSNEEVRSSAIWALGQVGRADPRVLPALMGLLRQREPRLVYQAAACAACYFGRAAKEAVPEIVRALETSPRGDDGDRYIYGMTFALQELGTDAAPAVPFLVRYADRTGSRHSREIASCLDRIDSQAAALVRETQRRKEEEFRRYVREVSGEGINPNPGPPVMLPRYQP